MKKRKPPKAPLYQPGDVFIVALPSGWFGAVRILCHEDRFTSGESYLVATTPYLEHVPPQVDDPRLTQILLQQRFSWSGDPAVLWVDREHPETHSYLGNLPVNEEEAATECGAFGGDWKDRANDEAFMEWRWENDREAFRAEVEKRSAEARASIKRNLRRKKKPKKMLADADFWGLITLLDPPTADGFDPEPGTERLITALAERTRADIKRFEETLSYKVYQLDTRAHAKASGNSDDGFLYARLGVVACGPDHYESVLTDPEKMPEEHELEELLYVAQTAYECKTGEELDYETGCGFGTGSNPDGWPDE